jgi:hypothetical protein
MSVGEADVSRVVEIAGDRITARSMVQTMSELAGTPLRPQLAGTTGTLPLLAKPCAAAPDVFIDVRRDSGAIEDRHSREW